MYFKNTKPLFQNSHGQKPQRDEKFEKKVQFDELHCCLSNEAGPEKKILDCSLLGNRATVSTHICYCTIFSIFSIHTVEGRL